MKIFIVGSDKVYAIENFYVNYLREFGIEVFHYPAQSIFYDYYQKNIFRKIVFKSGISSILKKINKQFKTEVERFKPDLIWVFKGMEIYPESLLWAKTRNIKLANYNPDNPFIFSGKGSGNDFVKRSIPFYNIHFTYNSAVKKQMEKLYNIPTAILPFGFDVSDQLYKRACGQKEIVKLCFLGNPDMQRARFLQQLALNGIEMDVYGCNWKKFVDHPHINICEPVYGIDFWLTLRRYRIQLNLSRPHTLDTHNMRTFEVPGIGGIQLAPDTLDHAAYFSAEQEIFLYSDLKNCIWQINKILSYTEAEVNKVRLQARNRSLNSGYSYKARAQQALTHIASLYE
jgi:spore maturation protein CgeB